MSDKSAIEWTDATWNPTTGCTKVSPACANCYIERTPPFRMKGRKFVKGHIPLALHMNRLDTPKHWTKPRRIFVNSLSDLFHPDVPGHFVSFVYNTMEATPQHTYQVLTKRADRMRAFIDWRYRDRTAPAHIWHGVSAENQHFADKRIAELVNTKVAVRFVSVEPMLGPIDLMATSHFFRNFIHWVIAGGESGPRVRPSNPDWFRSLRDQCVAVGIAFHFKQWGGRTPKANGRILDGRTWDEFPKG